MSIIAVWKLFRNPYCNSRSIYNTLIIKKGVTQTHNCKNKINLVSLITSTLLTKQI